MRWVCMVNCSSGPFSSDSIVSHQFKSQTTQVSVSLTMLGSLSTSALKLRRGCGGMRRTKSAESVEFLSSHCNLIRILVAKSLPLNANWIDSAWAQLLGIWLPTIPTYLFKLLFANFVCCIYIYIWNKYIWNIIDVLKITRKSSFFSRELM